MEILVVYLIGFLLVYVIMKIFRGTKSEKSNTFKDAFITLFVSLFSWLAALIILSLYIGEHWDKAMPKWLRKIL